MSTGFLPTKAIKTVAFWTVTACIILATVAGILLPWEAITSATADRFFWTAGILSFGSLSFLLTNYMFGNLERDLFRPSSTKSMRNKGSSKESKAG